MTCRDEILSCVKKLVVQKGEDSFALQEIVDCMKAQGTKYKETTIRTHITSRMCKNAPKHHEVTYEDFECTERGLYRIVRP